MQTLKLGGIGGEEITGVRNPEKLDEETILQTLGTRRNSRRRNRRHGNQEKSKEEKELQTSGTGRSRRRRRNRRHVELEELGGGGGGEEWLADTWGS